MTAAMQPSRNVGIAGTTLAHGLLIAFALWAAQRANRPGPRVYEVNLVAAPPVSKGPITPVENTPPAPIVKAPVIKPKPAKVVPKQVPPAAKAPTAAPTARNIVAPLPGVAPSTGLDVETMHQAGIDFPYPEYLRKIENEIRRRWNQSGLRPGQHAAIAFVINSDGTVPDSSILVDKSAGQYFDNAAMTAIESASAQGAFGRLPSGYNAPSLPILFNFTLTAKSPP